MGQYGRLVLVQQIGDSRVPTVPVLTRHVDGRILGKDGLFVMEGPNGPMEVNSAFSWTEISGKALMAALGRAEFVEEAEFPVTTPKQGYRQGKTAVGVVAKLAADDAIAFGCELSPAVFVDAQGRETHINGCIVVTPEALNAAGASKLKLAYDTREGEPIDTVPLFEAVTEARANGTVPYAVTFRNGDKVAGNGFRRGTQRQSGLDAVAQANTELRSSSVLSQLQAKTTIRAERPQGNGQRRSYWGGNQSNGAVIDY